MSHYHRMSIAEKQAYARTTIREPAMTCPTCDTQTTPADLIEHVSKRCTGPRAPGPGSKWVTWREAMAIISSRTLTRWVADGKVRYRGELRDRQFLLRDIAMLIAVRKWWKPRSSE